ncbi:hypothetical protein H0264_14570 [Nocardia huaxiensis]|uniref:Uncharacterized protein n=1 Tax=Nocardia huaxiensis TaxID=2755382 RepID=A0A7D6VCN4_9NOCA|nr:hypothetical protein [Nocardia huaxiensis]QLY33292.1 hypothetical protein H0264_14570 [Nocardia huaxiensis]
MDDVAAPLVPAGDAAMNHSQHHGYTVGGYEPSTGYETANAMHRNMYRSSNLMVNTAHAIPPEHRLKVFLLVLAFAMGLYTGVLLFGNRTYPQPDVVFCPAQTAEPVAVVPAECGQREVAR